jgi:hypothetical protein
MPARAAHQSKQDFLDWPEFRHAKRTPYGVIGIQSGPRV